MKYVAIHLDSDHSITAGSTHIPAGFGFGATSTRLSITFTLKVGMRSVNGGGDCPLPG